MSVQAIPLMLADADKKLSKGDDSSHPYGQLERERGNVNHDPYSVEESGDIGSNPIREYQKALFLIELYTIRAHEVERNLLRCSHFPSDSYGCSEK